MKLFNKAIAYLCVTLIAAMPTISLASTPICATAEIKDDYVVGFFNGVNNTYAQTTLLWESNKVSY